MAILCVNGVFHKGMLKVYVQCCLYSNKPGRNNVARVAYRLLNSVSLYCIHSIAPPENVKLILGIGFAFDLDDLYL